VGQKRWAPFGNLVLELDEGWNPKLPSSLYRANNLNLALFETYAAASQVDDFGLLPIPFSCVATNLQTGEATVFRQGSLMQAVRASLSVPSLMLPFEVEGNKYIDGGIAQNMPIAQVKALGAESVLAVKVNSSLQEADQLESLIDVLNQTINIGITRNLNERLGECDLLLEPDLMHYSSQDFKHISEIIAIGELYAREHIETIKAFIALHEWDPQPIREDFERDLTVFAVKKMETYGNRRISYAKIREYLGLEFPGEYSAQDIARAARRALDSQFFNVLYPVLIPEADGRYILRVFVEERQAKTLALNNAYNSEVKLTASAILSIDNQLFKNSKLLAQLVLGGRNELNVDYVKNFGEFWGIYYRVFSFVNEKTIYAYNENHHQVNSTKSLEWGATTGVGLFTVHNIISEAFLYYSNISLYRGISESDMPSRYYSVAGFGTKAYYESLDDFAFPKRGVSAYGSFNFARDGNLSDYIYSNFRGKIEANMPVLKDLSLNTGISIGTFIDSQDSQSFDQFPLGGINGFKGYSRYAISAPHFRIMQAGLLAEPWRNVYLQTGVQGITYDEKDFVGNHFNDEYSYYGGLGIRAYNFPIRVQCAINVRGELNFMLSIGNDWDIFHFSRK
jgi:NTE family protein